MCNVVNCFLLSVCTSIIFISISCAPVRVSKMPSSDVKASAWSHEPEGIKDIVCKEGEYTSFVLSPMDIEPKEDVFKPTFEEVSQISKPILTGPTIRLDLCFDFDKEEGKLVRLVQLNAPGTGSLSELFPKVELAQELIKTLVFNTDPSSFDYRFYSKSNDWEDFGLRIKGWNVNKRAFFSVNYFTEEGEGQFRDNTEDFLVGTFVLGNFEKVGGCPFGAWFEDMILNFGSVKLHAYRCRMEVASRGTDFYKYVKLELSDTSPHLPDSFRGKKVTVKDSDLLNKNIFSYMIFHHHCCDNFDLRLDQATYAFTLKVYFGGEEEACKEYGNAPARINHEETREQRNMAKYRIIYRDGFREEGFAEFPYWLNWGTTDE